MTPSPIPAAMARTPSGVFALPAPAPFVSRNRVDTNSTQTSADSHQVHECLAFQIVKERCSHFEPGPSPRGPTLERCSVTQSTGVALVEPDGIEPTTSCLQSRRSPN